MNIDFRNPGVLDLLAAQKVFITVRENDPIVEHYTPHTIYNKEKEYRILVQDGDGLFCPEWGEDLEHLPYFVVDAVDTLRVRNSRVISVARLRKGTKCFTLPKEVCARVALGKDSEDSLLMGLLTKHKA